MNMKIDNNTPLLSLNDFKSVVNEYKEDKIRHKLSNSANRFLLQHQLSSAIPKGRKYKKLKRMAKLFDSKNTVDNYLLAYCINRKIKNNRSLKRKLTKKDYRLKKVEYDEKIKNHFKILNKHWKPLGYLIRFKKDKSKTTPIVGLDKNELDVTPKII